MAFGKKTGLLLGIAAIGAYLWYRGRGVSASRVTTSLKPAPVGANETVSATSYRIISAKRPGLQYIQAAGSPGGALSFSSPTAGRFTRNVVQEGGVLWAEVAA